MISPSTKAKLRLLFEVAPLALLVEKAGGASSCDGLLVSGLDVEVKKHDQRTQVGLEGPWGCGGGSRALDNEGSWLDYPVRLGALPTCPNHQSLHPPYPTLYPNHHPPTTPADLLRLCGRGAPL